MPDPPASLGYRLPAEWEPHAATWLSWPHNRETWPGRFEAIPPLWAGMARTIAQYEPVHVLAGGEAMESAWSLLNGIAGVELHDVRTNDAWIRDHGPMFLTRRSCDQVGRAGVPVLQTSLTADAGAEPLLLDWDYNAWGGKYPPFDDDNRVPARVAELLPARRWKPGLVLEGGAVDANGRGALLAARRSLLNPNRNPGRSREEVESLLHDYCAAQHIVWLEAELTGDDTDGHVDQIVRFVNSNTVVAAVDTDASRPDYASLQSNLRRLENARDQDGRRWEVVTLPMPAPHFFDGQRLPASYVNFYVGNGFVLAPTFDHPADALALATLQQLFPDRQVHGLYAADLILGLGGIHCVTQQQPA